MSQTIQIYNLGNLPVAPVDDFHELQEDFKISDPDKTMKLALLIMTRGFKYAFKAWQDPDGKLWIIDAHQRKKALIILRNRGVNIPDIPYEPIFAKDKKEAVEEIAAYNSEFAKKNPDTILFDKYQISIDALDQFNLDFHVTPEKLDLGFDTKSIFSDSNVIDLDAKYDQLEEPEIQTITKQGDIWILGRHHLMCGDSCSQEDVTKLMAGKCADLIITDPPYNVNYEGKDDSQMQIANDNMSQDSFDRFIFKAFFNMFKICKLGASIYVFHSDTQGVAFRRNFERAGFKLAQCCIWVKNSIVMGRQDYQWKHEPILYGWREGEAHNWYADRSQSTIWNFDRPTRNDLHPTMKPIRLLAYPLLNSSKENDLVVDMFSGSGSTLMTCQQYSRTCYAMELDTNYVDATVSRFISAVGAEDVYLIRGGETTKYSQIQ